MAISQQHKLSINQSNDSNDYELAFHRNVLFLIVAGYKMFAENVTDYTDEEEPSITGEIVRCVNEYIEGPSARNWAISYVIEEESPENTKGKLGKRRKRVDIVCMRTGMKLRLRMKFEAKRLKRPGFPVSSYVGTAGLGEFISGNYAPGCDTAGMLGYIQSGDCDYWAKQISDDMNKKRKEVHLTEDGQWQKANLGNIDDCYKTRHDRPTVEHKKLLVYHLLLDFINKN